MNYLNLTVRDQLLAASRVLGLGPGDPVHRRQLFGVVGFVLGYHSHVNTLQRAIQNSKLHDEWVSHREGVWALTSHGYWRSKGIALDESLEGACLKSPAEWVHFILRGRVGRFDVKLCYREAYLDDCFVNFECFSSARRVLDACGYETDIHGGEHNTDRLWDMAIDEGFQLDAYWILRPGVRPTRSTRSWRSEG